METELDVMQQKILELESRIRAYDAEIESKRIQIAQKNDWLYDREQEFLDQAAIAAMGSYIIGDRYFDNNDIAKWAFESANALLAEKKRLQGVNND